MKAIISKEKPIRIVSDDRHPHMYRLQWKDGSKSVKYREPNGPLDDGDPIGSYGMYNLTRARDILKHYNGYVAAMKQSGDMAKNSLRSRSKTVTGETSAA